MKLIMRLITALTVYSQDYTITMYLNQYWKDERLSFSPEENRVLTLSGDFAEKIWVPDTFFANDKTVASQPKLGNWKGSILSHVNSSVGPEATSIVDCFAQTAPFAGTSQYNLFQTPHFRRNWSGKANLDSETKKHPRKPDTYTIPSLRKLVIILHKVNGEYNGVMKVDVLKK